MIFRVMLCACLIAIIVLGTSGCTQDDAGQTLQVEAYKGTEPIVFTGSGSITFTPRIVYLGTKTLSTSWSGASVPASGSYSFTPNDQDKSWTLEVNGVGTYIFHLNVWESNGTLQDSDDLTVTVLPVGG